MDRDVSMARPPGGHRVASRTATQHRDVARHSQNLRPKVWPSWLHLATSGTTDGMAGSVAAHVDADGGVVQAKLAVSQPGDVYEQEADRVADRVVSSTPGGGEKTSCAACDTGATPCPTCSGGQQTIQAKATRSHIAPPAGTALSGALRGGGQPLFPSIRAPLESGFGRDFSGVRIHTGHDASESARAIQAKAFTWGRNIAFSRGEFAPGSREGQRLLAHELAHVIQQGHAPPSKQGRDSTAEPTDGPLDRLTRTPDRIARQADAGVPSTDGGAPAQGLSDAGVPPSEVPHVGSPGAIDSPGTQRYSRQAACVATQGGCTYALSGGSVDISRIPEYNERCKDTGYSGPAIYPSEEECRQVKDQTLVDPEKVKRLQFLTTQYSQRLQRGELILGDARRIDAALRSAHAALARGGVPMPGVPDAVALSPTDDLNGPAYAFVPGLLYTGRGAVTVARVGAATEAVVTGATVAEGAAATEAVVAGATVAEGAAVTGGTVAAGGAAAAVGVALLGVALVVGAGLAIYFITTLDYPRVDPTIPQAVDDAIEEIQKTLDTAKAPVQPQATRAPRAEPVMPEGLSRKKKEKWKKCRELYDVYKQETGAQLDALNTDITSLMVRYRDNSLQPKDIADLCAKLHLQLNLIQREINGRQEYINEGCDEFDWSGQNKSTEGQRKGRHQDEVKNLKAQLGNAREALRKLQAKGAC